MGAGGNPWLVAMSPLVFGGKSRFLNPSWRKESAAFLKEVSKASKRVRMHLIQEWSYGGKENHGILGSFRLEKPSKIIEFNC